MGLLAVVWLGLFACHAAAHLHQQCRPLNELKYGSPESTGLLPEPLRLAVGNITAYTHAANYSSFTYNAVHPIEPGSTNIIGHCSTIVAAWADGMRNLYADVNGTLLPASQQEAATLDTIYDLASLTKLFTTVAALQQLDTGKLDLNASVARYLPAFAANGKANVTILQLMTHTSGFAADPEPPLYYPAYKTYQDKVNRGILQQPLATLPGSTYLYSDLNFMTLFLVLEAITGQQIDALIAAFTAPLGMHNTFFNRGNVEGAAFPFYARMATQEFQIAALGAAEPQRPQPVRGTVHDENAWALGGVSGHAGLFSTAADTAVFCQMLLNNGTYAGRRYLSRRAVDLVFTNFNARFPAGDAHALGFELDQYYTAGPMAGPRTASHTGFTGTALVLDRPSGAFFLHLANRVHPSRAWSSNNIAREALGYWVARALGRDVGFPPL